MALEILSAAKTFGGIIQYCRHQSVCTKTPMRFSVFTPPQATCGKVPILWWLSGLTCTEDNFTVKACAYRTAAELGLMIVAPDTSPRGDTVPNDEAYDFGQGAGFYVDATETPWAEYFQMYSYVTEELPALVFENFPADPIHQGISGHSMGGHGALTIGLKNPSVYKSVSAFSPIVAPSQCPWGIKAMGGYLGPDRTTWRPYDACALIEDGARLPDILIDQGLADTFLESQLKPALLEAVCAKAKQPLTLRRQEAYDHSYFFIATFIEDHLQWHAKRLK